MEFSVNFHRFGILHTELSVLLDGIVEQLLLLLHHRSYSHNFQWFEMLEPRIMLRTAQILTQTITQAIVQVSSGCFVTVIVFILHFILQKYGDYMGENRGYAAQSRSLVSCTQICTGEGQYTSGHFPRYHFGRLTVKFAW